MISLLSSSIIFMIDHQWTTSLASKYLEYASLLSAGHLLASKIRSISRIHWSASSRVVLPSKRDGWCWRKSSKLHSCTRGGGAWEDPAVDRFSPSWCTASKCLCRVASAAILADSICCKAKLCWFTILAFCCCMATNIASIVPHQVRTIRVRKRRRRRPKCHSSAHTKRESSVYLTNTTTAPNHYAKHTTETRKAHTYKP